MTIITAREFRAHQKKYFQLAEQETVYVTRRNGRPMAISPAPEDAVPQRDIMAEIEGALRQVRDHIDGKITLKTAESLIDELRNNPD